MLMPFQWAILTIEEAKFIMQYIEKSTATKSFSINYVKIEKAGMLEIYNKLQEFVELNAHFESKLRYLDTSDFARSDSGNN